MCEVLFLNSFPFTIWFYVLSHWHTSKLKGLTFASLVAQRLKHLPPIWETRVRSLGREDPLEKEMAIHSSILAWKIPWTEKPSRLQSTGSQRVGHNWATELNWTELNHSFWRRKWQPTPVFLPGKSHGRRSLVGYRLWGRRVGHDWAISLHFNHSCSTCFLTFTSKS